MSKYTSDDNRSMQLNDNNDRYYSSRGIDRYDDNDEEHDQTQGHMEIVMAQAEEDRKQEDFERRQAADLMCPQGCHNDYYWYQSEVSDMCMHQKEACASYIAARCGACWKELDDTNTVHCDENLFSNGQYCCNDESCQGELNDKSLQGHSRYHKWVGEKHGCWYEFAVYLPYHKNHSPKKSWGNHTRQVSFWRNYIKRAI